MTHDQKRSWLDFKILIHLQDLEIEKGRPAEFADLRDGLVPDEAPSVASAIRHLHKEGLVRVTSPSDVKGLSLVYITPQGKDLLLRTFTAGRSDCD